MDITNDLLHETAHFVEAYLASNLPSGYELRNYTATVRLVQTCALISSHTDLGEQERLKIILAAWFQYTGFCQDPKNYQTASAGLSTTYFKKKGLTTECMQEIEACILATRDPQQPITISSQILCDAETSWLADKAFFWRLKNLREEKMLTGDREIKEKDWLVDNIRMMENHLYFIPFSREMFEKQKQKNIKALQTKLTSWESSRKAQELQSSPKNEEKLKITLADDIRLERGVESLFRNTSRNQIHLIGLADYKANLIISINAIIISVILSVLVLKLAENKYLELPTLTLILTSVITILVAISATRPKIGMPSKGYAKSKDFRNNLLYFGHFYKMPFSEFNGMIKKTIVDKNDLYESLTADIYQQGLMLEKKFRHIKISYMVFEIGLVLSILAFIISFLLHQNASPSI